MKAKLKLRGNLSLEFCLNAGMTSVNSKSQSILNKNEIQSEVNHLNQYRLLSHEHLIMQTVTTFSILLEQDQIGSYEFIFIVKY